VTQRPEAFSQPSALFSLRHRRLLVCSLGVLIFYLAGCRKKSSPAPTVSIRNITRELVTAARTASAGRADVRVRPKYASRQPGKPQALAYDDIYITVPLTAGGLPDRNAHDAIATALMRVAEVRHLKRVAVPGAPGLERFDYFSGSRRTQVVHLIVPFGKYVAQKPMRGRPLLAIVIDDLGNDREQAASLFRLAYPLTVSVLPHESNSSEIAEEAHRRGYEVMLHLPIASNAGLRDESIELRPGMDAASVESTFTSMLNTVPYACGVNNHEGSLGTSDPKLMSELMPLLHQRNLFFVDSRTTAATVAETAARAAGVQAASRNVFLDDELTAAAIQKQFDLAVHDAREKGSALAIGHPHPETLDVLIESLSKAERQGVQLVFASVLAH
jgi:polysaccharide deacetylase 2 family uncharacterized protein YibQ